MIAPRSPADSSEEEHLSSSSTTSEEEEHREDDEEHDEVASQSSGSSNAQDNQAELARAWAIQRSLYNQNKGFEVCDDMVHSIKRIMKEKIFPKLKILSNTEQQYQCPDFVGKPVDQSRIICEIILREIDLEDADNLVFKVRFWITYRSLVKNQLVKYRSNCVEDLKREYFKGKNLINMLSSVVIVILIFLFLHYIVRELLLSSQDQLDDKTRAYLEGAQDLINIVTDAGRANNSLIISLREEQHKKAFFFFAREFLPCVVKRLFFRQNKLENLLSEFVTVSDEAFTLFLLENNVARWDAMFQSGTTKSNDSMPQQKYQAVNSGDEKNGKDGYGLQAILRFNEYYRSVTKGRSGMDTTVLERELLKNMEKLENGDGKINKKKRNKRKRDAELNIVDEDGKPLEVLCDL
jgi:hypothetical protein